MSEELILASDDLMRLRNEGYEVSIKHGYLVLSNVPYLDSTSQIRFAVLFTDLTLAGEKTTRPRDHQVYFSGDIPFSFAGSPISALGARESVVHIDETTISKYRFSNKPPGGYADYYEKMVRYVRILENEAKAIDSCATAQTFTLVETMDEESVFTYSDTASSRAGISELMRKFSGLRIGIVGVGGTGGYVLDQIAKTPVQEIVLFDGDYFYQHNAFRSPGAISVDALRQKPKKAEYLASQYTRMHKGVTAFPEYLDEDNIKRLEHFDFVFVAVDSSAARDLIFQYLIDNKIPFVDSGLDVQFLTEQSCLTGLIRTTFASPTVNKHLGQHVSRGVQAEDDVYSSNIQVSDLNMLAAALAVMRWKKSLGYYQDVMHEHQSVYSINSHGLSRDECVHD